MKPLKPAEVPATARIASPGVQVLRFGDLELDRRSIVARGPRGLIDLSLGEFRACSLLTEAAGADVTQVELAAICRIEGQNGRHAVELTISRLRSQLHRSGSTVTVSATRGIGWRLVAPATSKNQST